MLSAPRRKSCKALTGVLARYCMVEPLLKKGDTPTTDFEPNMVIAGIRWLFWPIETASQAVRPSGCIYWSTEMS